MATIVNNNGNPPPAVLPDVNDRSFCNLLIHCQLGAVASRIGTAVADFFTWIVQGIYNGLVWFTNALNNICCCTCLDDDAAPIAVPGGGENPDNPPAIIDFFQGVLNLGGGGNRNVNNGNLVPRRQVQVEYGQFGAKAPQVIPAVASKDQKPTPEVSAERRKEATETFGIIEAVTDFKCNPEILTFDLDAALEKYNGDQSPVKLLQWYDYGMTDRSQKNRFERILGEFRDGTGDKFKAVRKITSKINSILTEKRARINTLSSDTEKAAANVALRQEVAYVIGRYLDADNNCIDQTLSQVEDLAIDLLATENPLGKSSTTSLLQYRAAHLLLQYRANLIKDICVKQNPDEEHMADLEREVKKRVAESLGMKGGIFDTGAQFANMVHGKAEKAAAAANTFFEQYRPYEYLQEQCRNSIGTTPLARLFRNDLLNWATTYYGLGEETSAPDEFIALISEDADMNVIYGGNLKMAGATLLLNATGIVTIN